MTLYAGVLDLAEWTNHDTLSLLACVGYVCAGAAVGIRWFHWDSR